MKVNPAGFRKELDHLFEQVVLAIPTSQKQASPFMVVNEEEVMKCSSVDELLDYSDEVEVLVVWPGKKRSDVFYFIVKDLRDRIESK